MIEVRVADAIDKFDEALPLLEANWRESGSPIEFKADDVRRFYEFMDKSGAIFAIGAWDEGKLVGYSIVTFGPFPMNHSVRICNVDGLYIVPEYRSSILFGRLQSAVRNLSLIENADYIHWHAPAGSEFSDALAKRTEPMTNYFREALQ